uniref:UBX domain-containing protein n=1 Tax=Ditylenchus dipsaci TaxID=166011 RepID=A0A915DXD9_9BILA
MSDIISEKDILEPLESEQSDEGEELVDTNDSSFDGFLCNTDESKQRNLSDKTFAHKAPLIPKKFSSTTEAIKVICSEAVSSLLKSQYIVWGWDMTEQSSKLYEWLSWYDMMDVSQNIRYIDSSKYPLLVVVVKSSSSIYPVSIIRGYDGVAQAVEKLKQGRWVVLNESSCVKLNKTINISLAIDRTKQQQRVLQRQQESKDKVQDDEMTKQKLISQALLASTLPSEPAAADLDIITIRLRLPANQLKLRRFRMNEPVNWLITFVSSIGYDPQEYKVWTSDMPKQDVSMLDLTKTFKELNWQVREQIIANIDPNKVIMLIISHEPTTSKFTSTLKHGNGKIITIKSFDKILQFLLNHQQQIDEVQFLEVIFTPTLIHSIQQLNPAVLSRLVKFIKCDFRELLVAQFWQFFTVIIKPASLVLVDASGVSNERIGTLMNISSPFDGSLSLIREEGDGDLLQLDPDLIYTFCREKGQQLVIEEPFIKGDGQFLIDMFLQRFLHDLKPKVEGSDPYHRPPQPLNIKFVHDIKTLFLISYNTRAITPCCQFNRYRRKKLDFRFQNSAPAI